MTLIDQLAKAKALFKSFHERPAGRGELACLKQAAPEYALEVGRLYGIMYKTKETKEPYLHKFNVAKGARVFVSYDGTQIYIVGGGYGFTDRGFIG